MRGDGASIATGRSRDCATIMSAGSPMEALLKRL